MTPAIYQGVVFHKRFAPKVHFLKYCIFQILFDLENLALNNGKLKLFGFNRFNLLSFFEKDYGPKKGEIEESLFDRVKAELQNKALWNEGDKIYFLTMPRILGFSFNPISIYFVENSCGGISSIIYEVNNTFGNRHSYILPIKTGDKILKHSQEKLLHVSPFMDMDMGYDFKLNAPDETFNINIILSKLAGNKKTKILNAGFNAKRQELNDWQLLKCVLKMPFMTLGVVFAIHWEALHIWLKGIKYRPNPMIEKSSLSINYDHQN